MLSSTGARHASFFKMQDYPAHADAPFQQVYQEFVPTGFPNAAEGVPLNGTTHAAKNKTPATISSFSLSADRSLAQPRQIAPLAADTAAGLA
jgi:hypothetical protein